MNAIAAPKERRGELPLSSSLSKEQREAYMAFGIEVKDYLRSRTQNYPACVELANRLNADSHYTNTFINSLNSVLAETQEHERKYVHGRANEVLLNGEFKGELRLKAPVLVSTTKGGKDVTITIEREFEWLEQAHDVASENVAEPVRLLENPETREIMGYIMEDVQGETLEKWKPKDFNSAVNVSKQIISTIKALHAAKLYHVDFHDNNGMVERGTLTFKVIDPFGVTEVDDKPAYEDTATNREFWSLAEKADKRQAKEHCEQLIVNRTTEEDLKIVEQIASKRSAINYAESDEEKERLRAEVKELRGQMDARFAERKEIWTRFVKDQGIEDW